MFRLADFTEDTPLYHYISSISSKTILKALDEALSPMDALEDFYADNFSEGVFPEDFFNGLSEFIKERADVTEDRFCDPYSEDTRAGLELIRRKVDRMKEKMADQANYYTFDLLEEYLFNSVIEFFYFFNVEIEGRTPREEKRLKAAMKEMSKELIDKYDVDEEYAEDIAESAVKIEKMSLEFSETYFWDDDFNIVFSDGFVKGIRSLVSGTAAIMGYGYEDVCSIFTDVGITAPVKLVGTEAAFDTVGGVAAERMREAVNSLLVPEPTGEFKKMLDAFKELPEGEDDLPFN